MFYIFMKSKFHFTYHTFGIKHEKPFLIPKSLRFCFFSKSFTFKSMICFELIFAWGVKHQSDIAPLLFIYFWLCWVSVAAPGLSLGAVREGGALSIEVCGLWAHGLSDWLGLQRAASAGRVPGWVALHPGESSWTRGWAHVPCPERQIPHCRTTRDVQASFIFVSLSVQLLRHRFLKSLSFLHLIARMPLSRILWHVCVDLSLGASFCSTVCFWCMCLPLYYYPISPLPLASNDCYSYTCITYHSLLLSFNQLKWNIKILLLLISLCPTLLII